MVLVCLIVLSTGRAFMIQGMGGSLASGTTDDMDRIQLGLHIYTGGIAAQEVFVLAFCVMVVQLYRKLNKEGSVPRDTDWKGLLRVMMIALALITVSNLYQIPSMTD